ncbi:hypothetical protein Rsub_01936 [Raphidocelis subcapitata]|uniref:F-box domain-containing protein n=1 Tax=Raphidocelis subcapitata TaxID=307507 RepID=A0A2V0NP41_9CHLO|nr:hypothetical protein Rsub_01936 [Raphidocelis subcapitata]|eukprot:GBF89364.1 hypothetical protein Rsub_01936 [Raphidocelis subcapitata]
MPDHLVVCWVASTPSTCVWRHPCVVLAARVVLRGLSQFTYLMRTRLPRLAADSLATLHDGCPIRRAILNASGARAAKRARRADDAGAAAAAAAPRLEGGAGGSAEDAAPPAAPAAGQPLGDGYGLDMPLEILQRLGPWLNAADLASARLTCRAWRDCLGSQVAVVALPPALWQRAARGQLAQLRRLTAAFPLLRTVACGYERGAPLDSRSIRRTMGLLARTTPTLSGVRLRGMVDAQNWPALAFGLEPLAARLVSLDLPDACWPDAASMGTLAAALTALQRLRLHSCVFSRLTAGHVDAIAGMSRLRELSLGFRTVEGTAASPMALDPLSGLGRLVALDLEYTGLLELSSGVGFRRPEALAALTALTSLSIRLVPLSGLDALSRLSGLRALHLVQMAPLTARQADALPACTALTRLEVEPLPWELLPALGRLPRLQCLGVHLAEPNRGPPPPHAADAVLSLAPLSRLRCFALAGQVELRQRHIAALAAAWPSLRALDLCCVLADGTSGFSALTALKRLRLSPYHWDVWSNEAPLLLHPAELPAGLTCLEARDVWVAAPGRDAALLSTARSSDFSWGVGICPAVLRAAAGAAPSGGAGGRGAGGGAGAALGEGGCGSGTCGIGVDCACAPRGEAEPYGCGFGGFGDSIDEVEESTVVAAVAGSYWAPHFHSSPNAPWTPPLSAAERAAALTLSTPALRRLVLRCIGPAHGDGGELPLPVLSRLTALEELDLHHSSIRGADIEAITLSPAAATLRALRLVMVDDGARAVGSALTKLTRLGALEALQVHAHERALNRRVRAAIASMDSLRRLTLVTSPDFPASFAHGLLVLTRLRQLAVLRVGLGFGALDALRRLRACVARALPRCQFEMLSDVDTLLDADAAEAGDGGDDGDGGPKRDDDDGGVGAGAGASAARARGPRHAVRLMRSS